MLECSRDRAGPLRPRRSHVPGHQQQLQLQRIRAVVSAIEPGGRAVADDVRIPYRPAPLYIGLKPQFEGRAERNTESAFDVVALDADGAPVAAAVSWQLMRIDWEYDWYRTEGERCDAALVGFTPPMIRAACRRGCCARRW